MSQPEADERRESSWRLLRDDGFTNVSFPDEVGWSEIDEEWMVAADLLSSSLFSRLKRHGDTDRIGEMRYAANALTHIQRVRTAGEANESIIIMEDDLMAAAPVAVVREQICRTLGNLPPTADLVYLEYCYESCSLLRYDERYPGLARASEPSCSAAILFTAQGARKVATLCLPVFDAVDRMYPQLIRKGWLEAYVMTPAAFYQVCVSSASAYL
jgi:hypothetical protein